ncbi:hypothetical protein GCM10027055_31090 [Janibacter alkaliphilus]
MWDHQGMSTPPGGPNVPPPPGDSDGFQTQPPQGEHPTQPPQHQSTGSSQPAGDPGGQHAGGQTPADQGPKKSRTGLVVALVGGLVLVLAVIGVGAFFLLGGDDDEEGTASSTTSAETQESSGEGSSSDSTGDGSSTSSPSSDGSATTSSGSSTSSSPATSVDVTFPESFDGWTKADYEPTDNPDGQSAAAYTKGDQVLSVVVTEGMGVTAQSYESLWDDSEQVGDAYCGTLSTATMCAQEQDGQVVLLTMPDGEAQAASEHLTAFLEEL